MPRQPAETESTAGDCPFPIEPNDNLGWIGREPTADEQEVVDWLKSRRLPSRILHVGVGTALLWREFGDCVVQGLTKDGGESDNAQSLGLEAIVCNKYDLDSYRGRLRDPFDCIVDVNIRSYACCDRHFKEYMGAMLATLSPSGMLLTSRRGLDYLVPTSLSELRTLCPQWRVRTHGKVVVMRPGYMHRFRQFAA